MIRFFMILFLGLFCSLFLHAQQIPKMKLTDSLYILAGIETAKQSEEIKRLYEKQTAFIKDSGLLFKAINIKSKAPDFTVTNVKGKTFSLSAEIQQGPVILLWSLGSWNKYCTMALRYFQAYSSEFRKYGVSLVALSAEIPEKSALNRTKNKITFDIFQDKDNAIAKQYGIVYNLNDTLRQNLEMEYQLSKFLNEKVTELPLAATYLIHPNGKVVFAFFDADYTKRAEPTDFLRVVKGMGFPERK